MKYAIELKDVLKDYGDFKLDNISFVVPEGCICGFIGQNGAGKTTTIKLILDIIKKDGGEIKVFDQNVDSLSELKDEIGVVYDEMGFHDFSVRHSLFLTVLALFRKVTQPRHRARLGQPHLLEQEVQGDHGQEAREQPQHQDRVHD